MRGSPPRVREEPLSTSAADPSNGITPACAGRTFHLFFQICYTRDHPRVCGKNSIFLVNSSISLGSPPRVREEHASTVRDIYQRRITPACAGRTPVMSNPTLNVWDHPRVCGKNPQRSFTMYSTPGSPPRVREELDETTLPGYIPRITPACAGRTRHGAASPFPV